MAITTAAVCKQATGVKIAHALGYVYFMIEKLPDAMEAYQLSIQYGPDYEDVLGAGIFSSHYHIGLLYEGRNEPIKALEQCAIAIQINPQYRQTLDRCIGFISDYKALLREDLFGISTPEQWLPALINTFQTCRSKADSEGIGLLLQTAKVISAESYDTLINLP